MNKSIERVIHDAVDAMGLRYIYDRWQMVNIHLDGDVLPCVVNVLPVSGSFTIGRLWRETVNAAVAFLDKAELDFDAVANEAVVDRCKARAVEFVARLNADGRLAAVTGVQYSVVYDRADTATTGILVELALTERVGACPPYVAGGIGEGCGCGGD